MTYTRFNLCPINNIKNSESTFDKYLIYITPINMVFIFDKQIIEINDSINGNPNIKNFLKTVYNSIENKQQNKKISYIKLLITIFKIQKFQVIQNNKCTKYIAYLK